MARGELLDDLIRRATGTLAAAGIEAPRQQTLALAEHASGLSKAALLARLREPLEATARAELERLVSLRARHHPLQYLLGQASFLDFQVRVEPGVFIPRPETELLVERALELWESRHRWAIDLCTGSGAIAIALARARPRARVLAIDVSDVALHAARANARDLGVADRVAFLRADLLHACVARGAWREELGVLVCNPPYAPHDDVVQPEVRDHEPTLAWSGGPIGTEVYASLIPQAALLVPPGRPLLLELGWGQEAAVRSMLNADRHWEHLRIDNDFQGIPRVFAAMRATSPMPEAALGS